jgi:hypothetical protein
MSKMKYVHNDVKWVTGIERGLDEYLGELWSALHDEDSDDASPTTPDISLTGDYFCGCDVCINRESFAYLLPVIIEGFKAGKFEENEDYTP